MKVAAYQAPLAPGPINQALSPIRKQIVPIIRADVAGRADGFVSYGSSAIIDRNGNVLAAAPPGQADLLVGNVENH